MKASKQIPCGPRSESVKQRQSLLAYHFRNEMTEGLSFEETNKYRQSFFDEVIEQANRVGFSGWSSPFEDDHPSSSRNSLQIPYIAFLLASYSTQHNPLELTLTTGNVEYGVLEAGTRLKDFIDEHDDILSEVEGTVWPLVVLAFDEAHILTEFPVDDRGWTIYSELRRCLCQLLGLPMFTLFLSTAGKFRLFSPDRPGDLPGRVVLGHKRVLPPITETGFDQFALPAIENETTLDQVVEDKWICSLGRPLCVFLACALFRRTHIVLRVGLPPVITLVRQMVSFELRLCALLFRNC